MVLIFSALDFRKLLSGVGHQDLFETP